MKGGLVWLEWEDGVGGVLRLAVRSMIEVFATVA